MIGLLQGRVGKHGNTLMTYRLVIGRELSSGRESTARERGHWAVEENRRKLLEEIGSRQGVKETYDWLFVSRAEFVREGGSGLLGRYGGSLQRLLRENFPQERGFCEDADAFHGREDMWRVPSGHWEVVENRRAFLERLAGRHSVTSLEGWKRVKAKHITRERGGRQLLASYGGSFTAVLQSMKEWGECNGGPARWLQPNTAEERESLSESSRHIETLGEPMQGMPQSESQGKGWATVERVTESDCRPQVGWGHWERRENRESFFRRLQREFHIEDVTQWKTVTRELVRERGGAGLLAKYGHSLTVALRESLPELNTLQTFEFRQARERGHWKERENRLAFMGELAMRHRLPHPSLTSAAEERGVEGWRQLSTDTVKELSGGAGFLSHYGGSFFKALVEFFGCAVQERPGAWRKTAGNALWKNEKWVTAIVHELEEKLRITTTDEWLRVSQRQLRSAGAPYAMSASSHRLFAVLAAVYPTHEWDVGPTSHKKSQQRQLRVALATLFPDPSLQQR